MDESLVAFHFNSEIQKLNKLVSEWIGLDRVIQNGNVIFVKLQKINETIEFLLRIDIGDKFPLEPANYTFVNPITKLDDSLQHWPTYNQNAFKSNENPRWICIAGTLEYKKHHAEHQYNPKINTLNQTIFHIFREINGWKRNE